MVWVHTCGFKHTPQANLFLRREKATSRKKKKNLDTTGMVRLIPRILPVTVWYWVRTGVFKLYFVTIVRRRGEP